jgi:ABC-type Fe3+-hydroxamate transport system substrate-binding protein
VPSVTETLLAWGIEPVACTRFCEQPALRHVGGTKDPDVTGIIALAPDIVVLDREENRREDADALAAEGVRLHVTHVTSLDDVAPTLTLLAAALGVQHTRAWREQPQRSGGQSRPLTRGFVPIWRRPWMTLNAQTYGSSLLAACGVHNVFATEIERYPTVTLEDAAARAPDLVLAPTEPYPFTSRHVTELKAVATDVRIVDGRDLFWWGARTEGAVARLAQALW